MATSPATLRRKIQTLERTLRTTRPMTPDRLALVVQLHALKAEQQRPQNRAAVARYRAAHKAEIAQARAVFNALMVLRRHHRWEPPPPSEWTLRPLVRALRTCLRDAELAILVASLQTPATPTKKKQTPGQ